MTLTENEKREVRETDPRAAAILERVDNLPDEISTGCMAAFVIFRVRQTQESRMLIRMVESIRRKQFT